MVSHERPTRSGYVFAGWTVNGQVVQRVQLEGDITVMAQWSRICTITYDANGGSWGTDQNGQEVTTRTDQALSNKYYQVNMQEPTRDGFTFQGWTYNGRYVSRILLSRNVTLKASWDKNYTVTYDANGGSVEDYGGIAQTAFTVGAEPGMFYVDENVAPEKEGSMFLGWMLPNNAVVRRFKIEDYAGANNNVTLKAKWEAYATVTVDANGGYWSSNDGSTFAVHTMYETPGLFYPGWREPEHDRDQDGYEYEFMGWKFGTIGQDGSYGELNFVDSANLVSGGSYAVVAQWVKAVNVAYHANGGEFNRWDDNNNENPNLHNRRAFAGNDYYIEGWTPYLEGNTFVGWSTEENAAADDQDILYTGDRVQLDDNIDLYAVWHENVIVTYDCGEDGWLRDDWYGHVRTETRESEYGRTYDVEGWWVNYDGPYQSAGWILSEESANLGYEIKNGQIENLKHDITLVPDRKAMPTVTYEANGGWWWDNGKQITTKLHWDQEGYIHYVGKDEPDHPEGYQFTGWYDEEGNPAPDSVVMSLDEEYVYYAHWAKEFDVYYENGGIGGWGWYDEYRDEYEWESIERDTTEGEYTIDEWMPYCRGPYEFAGYTLVGDTGSAVFEAGQTVRIAVSDKANAITVAVSEGICTITVPESSESLTLRAAWTKLPVVTFHAQGGYYWGNNGEQIDHEDHWEEAGHTFYIRWEQPDNDYGWRFDHWYSLDDQDKPVPVENGDSIVLEAGEQYDFYACWGVPVTVTYNANGGGWDWDGSSYRQTEQYDYNAYTGTYGVGWDYPEKPNRNEHLRFAGWSLNPNAETGDYWFEDEISDDTVYYAVWTEREGVVYDLKGGEISNRYGRYDDNGFLYDYDVDPESYTVGVGGPLHKDGYSFLGWSTSENANEVTYGNFTDTIEINELPMTLYAVWEDLIDVTYDANGGHFRDGSDQQVQYWHNGQSAYIGGEEPERDGFRFVGWLVNGEAVDRLRVTENTTVLADWERIYTVTFEGNGGVFSDGNAEKTDERTRDNWYYLSFAEQPTRAGYVFDGWTLDGEYVSKLRLSEENNSYTVVAQWTVPEELYDVNFHAGDGWFESDREKTHTDQAVGNYYLLTEEPVRTGYCFVGWNYTGEYEDEVFSMLYGIDDDVDLYAVWVDACTVTYVGDGGFFRNSQTGEYTESSVSVTAPMYSDYFAYDCPADVAREGYEFHGWRDSDGNLYGYDPGAWITLNGNVTFHADWTPYLDVCYDANGGTLYTDESGTKVSVWSDEGENNKGILAGDYQLYDWWPEYDGYEFRGWNTDKNAQQAIYLNGQWVALNADTTFYAIWEEIPAVTYDANGGGWGWDGSEYDETVRVNVVGFNWNHHIGMEWPEREGYEFVGWSEDENATEAAPDWGTNANGSLTVYAIWRQQVKVTYDVGDGSFENGEKTRTEYLLPGQWLYLGGREEPTRAGYEFVGWLYGNDYVDEIEITEDYLENGITLVADWESDLFVTFNANGGEFSDDEETKSEQVEYGWFYLNEMEHPVRDGFEFQGWVSAPNATTIIQRVRVKTASITVYAKWAEISVKIEKESGEDALIAGDELQLRAVVTPWNSTDPVTWSSSNENVAVVDDNGTVTIIGFGNAAITAEAEGVTSAPWYVIVDHVLVTYNANGGTANPASERAGLGSFVPTATATKDNCSFNGWMLNGEVVQTLTLTENVELVASWTEQTPEPQMYTVNYSGEGGQFSDGDRSKSDSAPAGNYTIIAETPTKVGFTFTGWLMPDNETVVQPGAVIQLTDNINYLAAQWQANGGGETPEPQMYTVNYSGEGGKFSDNTLSKSDSAPAGNYTIIAETPTKDGFTFTGWLMPDNVTVVQPGAVIQLTGNINYLAAQYSQNLGVEINETNFPDAKFRNYVRESYDINEDGFLSDEEVADVEKMEEKDLCGPGIGTLKGIKYFTNLRVLECPGNEGIDLSDIKDLPIEVLKLNACQLTELSIIKDLEDLEELYLPGNDVSSLDLSNNPNLRRLECHGNFRMTELDISNNGILKALVSSVEPSTEYFGGNKEKTVYSDDGSYLSITKGMTITCLQEGSQGAANEEIEMGALLENEEAVTGDGTEPEATKPEATEPEATEPGATEPEATEPEGTEPEGTEPEGTEPGGDGTDGSGDTEDDDEESAGGEDAEGDYEEPADEGVPEVEPEE